MIKKKREQILREQRLATVLERYGTTPLDDYLRGIAYNLHFGRATIDNNVCNDVNDELFFSFLFFSFLFCFC